MSNMFKDSTTANPDVSKWTVSNVTNMSSMFEGATNANPNVSEWDVSSVESMVGMFFNASSANPIVSNWDVSNVIDMAVMFFGATSANPDISSWRPTVLTSVDDFMQNSAFDQSNYNRALIMFDTYTTVNGVTWSAPTANNGNTPGSVVLDGTVGLPDATAAYTNLDDPPRSWTIL
jgi:surface protein